MPEPYFMIVAQTDEGGDATQGGTAEPGGSTGTGDPANPQTGNPSGPNLFPFLIPLALVFIFMIWSSSSSQRKERKKRDAMLSQLRRHDKVQTVGGVIGSVVEIKDSEVVLKVDEANNIKMRFARSSIQQVLSESADADVADETDG